MTIKRENFDNDIFPKKAHNRKEHPISKLFENNKNLAFKCREIEKRVKMKGDAVRSMLRTLRIDGLVVHKNKYYAWKI